MTTKPLGSVFLGDLSRNPFTSPPASPPPVPDNPDSIERMDSIDSVVPAHHHSPTTPTPVVTTKETKENPAMSPPPEIDPETSLALRVHWLEALLHGPKTSSGEGDRTRPSNLQPGHTILRDVHDFQTRLDGLVAGHDGIRQFLARYEQHAALLTPAFALSGTIPELAGAGAYENMSPEELEALLAEMEPDIRAADRDMQEIEALEKKGVLGADHLTDFEGLKPRLDALVKAHEEDTKTALELEQRFARLAENYASHVDALSELFVDWNDDITSAELRTYRLERAKKERERMGY